MHQMQISHIFNFAFLDTVDGMYRIYVTRNTSYMFSGLGAGLLPHQMFKFRGICRLE